MVATILPAAIPGNRRLTSRQINKTDFFLARLRKEFDPC
jgi:hypothetical protein